MQTKNLQAWLNWLENYKDTNINLGLDRILSVAKKLNLDTIKCPVITVAGTNGKGSTVATLEKIALIAGLRTGSYTSPHLFVFNERIKINGIPITDQECINNFQIIVSNIPDNIKLTYFEIATLVALMTFQNHTLDLVILEVGIGGRLDAVNIVNNQISIITSIALEHCQYLGNTIDNIAYEKAGIIKLNNIVICASINGYNIIQQQAIAYNAKILHFGEHFEIKQYNDTWSYSSKERTIDELALTTFPMQNAACAITAIDALKIKVSTQQISQVIANIKVLGRFQRYYEPCEIILDVAHNPEAAEWLADKLNAMPIIGKTCAIVNISSDKDWQNIVKPFLHFVDCWYTVTIDNFRLLKADVLAENISTLTVKPVITFNNIANAIEDSVSKSTNIDRIIVFGSFFTVEAALRYINGKYGSSN
jgi:dihydrofolate synthase/folylpolyglutamate synthase